MTKTRSTKSALILSVMALLICFTMLLGTTFAWFTDSVTSAGNKIVAGTLDVDLVDADGNSMAGEIIEFVTADGRAQDEILWEPGCTYYTEPVYVVNNGNLALKYDIIISGIVGNTKLLEAIEWTVTIGNVTTALEDMKGTLLAGEKTEAIVLKGHMKKDAGNEYQGLIAEGVAITVAATQLTYEKDSFDDQYDEGARIEYTYDSAKTAKENAAALQALINTAAEGTTIVVGSGTYDVSGISGNQIKLATDGITLLGQTGVVINDDGEVGNNVQAVIQITADDVTVSNIYATDKGENTVILVSGANNVTVTNCTLKGYASSTWGQYLEAGVMIYVNDPAKDPITKYTVTNNTFIDCNINIMNGAGNGGKSEDLIISGNTFNNAAVLIEHNQTSVPGGEEEAWHLYDINVLPTIKDNLFKSPSIWLGSTPYAIYLRVYRDNDVTSMTPASYWTDFAANNTILEYTGDRLSSEGMNALVGVNGVQMRPNGKIQYYGLSFAAVDAITTADELVDAFANIKAGDTIYIANDIDMTGKTLTPVSGNKGFNMIGNGNTISNLNTTANALFVNNSGSSAYTFDGVVLENCSVNSTSNYGALFVGDGDTSDAITIKNCVVKNCTVKSAKYAAAFVGYTAGYNVVNNGPVYSDVLISNCEVSGVSIVGGGSAGVAVAHSGGNVDTTTTIENLKIDDVVINGEDAEHTGIVVGTAHIGKTVINNVTYNNVTGNYNTATVIYGRFVPGTTGTLTIDGANK